MFHWYERAYVVHICLVYSFKTIHARHYPYWYTCFVSESVCCMNQASGVTVINKKSGSQQRDRTHDREAAGTFALVLIDTDERLQQ